MPLNWHSNDFAFAPPSLKLTGIPGVVWGFSDIVCIYGTVKLKHMVQGRIALTTS